MWIFFCTLRLICGMMKLLCSCVIVVYFSFSLYAIKHILWASEFWSEKRVLCCTMCIILCAFLSLNATHKRHRYSAHPDPLLFEYFPRCYCVTIKFVCSFFPSMWFFPFLFHFLFDVVYLWFSILRASIWLLNEWVTENRTHKKPRRSNKSWNNSCCPIVNKKKTKNEAKKRQSNYSATYIYRIRCHLG